MGARVPFVFSRKVTVIPVGMFSGKVTVEAINSVSFHAQTLNSIEEACTTPSPSAEKL